MEKIIEELRNANLEIEEIKAKKEALRKKLEEHRSAITAEELAGIKAEKEKLDAELSVKTALRRSPPTVAPIKTIEAITILSAKTGRISLSSI